MMQYLICPLCGESMIAATNMLVKTPLGIIWECKDCDVRVSELIFVDKGVKKRELYHHMCGMLHQKGVSLRSDGGRIPWECYNCGVKIIEMLPD